MEKNVVIAPVGDNLDALFAGIKEFPTERIVLISPKERVNEAKKIKKDLEKFNIPVQIKEIEGNIWEETFRAVSEVKDLEKDSNLIINVATGDRMTTCAATSAAYVNGIKAFNISPEGAMLLPVLKFSYYKMLTDKKLEILKVLDDPTCCNSLEDLSKKTKMSLPLISYHINGNLKSEGLKEMGLVDTRDKKGRVDIKLSMLGKMLLKGYIK